MTNIWAASVIFGAWCGSTQGHEAQKSGVGVSMRSRLTTIFSTSRDHFGSDVEATCGCVLVLLQPSSRLL